VRNRTKGYSISLLYGKIAYAITDNGANVVLALEHLKDIGDSAYGIIINVIHSIL